MSLGFYFPFAGLGFLRVLGIGLGKPVLLVYSFIDVIARFFYSAAFDLGVGAYGSLPAGKSGRLDLA